MQQLGFAQWLLQPLDRRVGEVVTDVSVTGSLVDEGRGWLVAQILLDGFDSLLSIHHGHVKVHEDDVIVVDDGHAVGFFSTGGDGWYFEAELDEETRTDDGVDLVVIDDEDLNFSGRHGQELLEGDGLDGRSGRGEGGRRQRRGGRDHVGVRVGRDDRVRVVVLDGLTADGEGEGGALSDSCVFRVDPDLAAHQLDKQLADRQAQPSSSVHCGHSVVSLLVLFKDLVKLVMRNTTSCVPDVEPQRHVLQLFR
mmetsp:Transcript_38405/g.63779  ORF Transcript_38405/g.63779 Transcript_38405/m.63779 type:complete len:252 (-) Transcript_38405:259-1014(-)